MLGIEEELDTRAVCRAGGHGPNETLGNCFLKLFRRRNVVQFHLQLLAVEGGREAGMERGSGGGREGGRQRVMERGSGGGREGGRKTVSDGGMEWGGRYSFASHTNFHVRKWAG